MLCLLTSESQHLFNKSTDSPYITLVPGELHSSDFFNFTNTFNNQVRCLPTYVKIVTPVALTGKIPAYLCMDSTSRLSSLDGEMMSEFATEPTWLA